MHSLASAGLMASSPPSACPISPRSGPMSSKRARTVEEACRQWRASRVDVTEGTRVLHRVALGRVVPILGEHRVDDLTIADVNRLVTELAAGGKKRETIRK